MSGSWHRTARNQQQHPSTSMHLGLSNLRQNTHSGIFTVTAFPCSTAWGLVYSARCTTVGQWGWSFLEGLLQPGFVNQLTFWEKPNLSAEEWGFWRGELQLYSPKPRQRTHAYPCHSPGHRLGIFSLNYRPSLGRRFSDRRCNFQATTTLRLNSRAALHDVAQPLHRR